MSASNFNLRGIPDHMIALLKKEAKRLNTSVNALILKIIERGLGITHERTRPIYHDLDHLAGTWSSEDAINFQENTKFFEQIDEDLWR